MESFPNWLFQIFVGSLLFIVVACAAKCGYDYVSRTPLQHCLIESNTEFDRCTDNPFREQALCIDKFEREKAHCRETYGNQE